MSPLPDDQTFDVIDIVDGEETRHTVPYSDRSLQLKSAVTQAIQAKNRQEFNSKVQELERSLQHDIDRCLGPLGANSRAGTDASQTVEAPTDTNSTQSPPTTGTQNPSVFGADETSSKKD